ncbi:glycosyltransferase family 2 protein [Thiopseudomonas denitrificans]|uniref:Rhamnosyltransferase n=1 Tax=Thiopseudomonas denitrificans TaxID=1501432 RepID=A0A4R6TXN4_9GAMM|nr:glycosyltransferase family A protein [Thiopseudomonas denitrificans]TDQ37552.1 rhamnosyltransferase [Thiopseudomonas denitrificans]
MRAALIIPVRNAGPWLDRLLPALAAQTVRPDQWLVVDSSSSDDTVERFEAAGADVHVISASEFNHGGTREWARRQVAADVIFMLTQDAIPEPDCFERLLEAFENPEVAVAYARQLPRPGSGLFERHARLYNYGAESRLKSLADAAELGVKTCFSSDSCSAYRASVLEQLGGFPQDVIGSEDAYVAGKVLLAGHKVHYVAEARVEHSHHYSILEEFRRYFDIGVFYGRERWIDEHFGAATGEGRRFVSSEMKMALQDGQWYLLPSAFVRNGCKLIGYKLGRTEAYLPNWLKRRVGMFFGYWVKQ